MDPADVLITIILLAPSVVLAIGWFVSARRVRQLEAVLRDVDVNPDPRTDALERTVGALTDQLEQLASGQEFLTRLIAKQSERLAGAAPAPPPSSSPPPVSTPH